jgi:hypothetical protein
LSYFYEIPKGGGIQKRNNFAFGSTFQDEKTLKKYSVWAAFGEKASRVYNPKRGGLSAQSAQSAQSFIHLHNTGFLYGGGINHHHR